MPDLLSKVLSKHSASMGVTPAVLLWNPKYPHNVGAALRAASCYDFSQVWYTGNRINEVIESRGRLPREERMKGYQSVALFNTDKPFDAFASDVVPVAIEISPSAELLTQFEHPEKALYVFGPEDGSIPSVALRHCHRHVVIPTAHCLNLATAVATVLYDRRMKRQMAGLEEIKPAYQILNEQRGWSCELEDDVHAEKPEEKGNGWKHH